MSDCFSNEYYETLDKLSGIQLLGPATLLEKFVSPDEIQDKYRRYNGINAKRYFLVQLLCEVQKSGFAMRRWLEFCRDELMHKTVDEMSQSTKVDFDSIIDEQSIWRRKLSEGLVTLILFSKTNLVKYFHHYLQVSDCEHYRYILKEQRDFFSTESKSTKQIISKLQTIANKTASKLDLQKCWYLRKRKLLHGSSATAIQSSFNFRLKIALEIALDSEKVALAYTYSIGFGESSQNIHFTPNIDDERDRISRYKFSLAQITLLGTTILSRAHSLLGMKPEGVNKVQCFYALNHLQEISVITNKAEVGDFVLAGGIYLGEVLDIEMSSFGYESYLIKYLDERPMRCISEDWFTAFEIQIYLKRDDIINGSLNLISSHGLTIELSESEIGDTVRKSIVSLWKYGIREFLKKNAVRIYKKTSNS
ncbi:hypothetical protein KA005_67115 [bacterium]|nr:hypothetical protein [bacterium]